MIRQVAKYMAQHAMPQPPAKLLVAVSGGIDSIVLLHILTQLQYQCVVAHCNFHLRGDDSDGDAEFVANLAKQLGCAFKRVDFQTERIAKEQKVSIEMAARDLRYEWFKQQMCEEHCAAIAVAHHANDCAETILLNLTRGASIDGLRGILPVNGDIIRPLLCCTREDIEHYAQQNQLLHRFDKSNDNTQFKRNFVRHDLIPQFNKLNPKFVQTVCHNAEHLTDVSAIYHAYISRAIEQINQQQGNVVRLNKELLLQQIVPKAVLYEALQPFGVNSDTAASLFDCIETSGKRFITDKYEILVDRSEIIIQLRTIESAQAVEIATPDTELQSPLHLKFELLDMPVAIDKSANMAYFDADKLQFPLQLRPWQQGDIMVPFGMQQHKKVSDLLIDNKVSCFDKTSTMVLTSNDEIIWLVGIRGDNQYRISASTKKVICVTFYR